MSVVCIVTVPNECEPTGEIFSGLGEARVVDQPLEMLLTDQIIDIFEQNNIYQNPAVFDKKFAAILADFENNEVGRELKKHRNVLSAVYICSAYNDKQLLGQIAYLINTAYRKETRFFDECKKISEHSKYWVNKRASQNNQQNVGIGTDKLIGNKIPLHKRIWRGICCFFIPIGKKFEQLKRLKIKAREYEFEAEFYEQNNQSENPDD